ncbi:hypothetical protein PspLS_10319 [Pyricularia sp. CBS 133598]|nr:hypothetical protein PspLS_10319 [Pyricularia sp. CBS 133598]
MAAKVILDGLPGLQKWPEELSDVAVHCGNEAFKLHKIEATSNEIRLPNDDPETFKRLVQFCYSGTYTEKIPDSGEAINNTDFWSKYLSPEGIYNKYISLSGVLGAAGAPRAQGKANHSLKLGSSQDNAELSDTANRTEDDEPKAKSQLNPKVDGILRAVITAAKLYIMAEAFLMPALKVVAFERFLSGMHDLIHPYFDDVVATPELVAVIEDVYTSLPASDIAIKEPICRLISYKRHDSVFWGKMSPAMRRNGALATGVLNYLNILIPDDTVQMTFYCDKPHQSARYEVLKREILEGDEDEYHEDWMRQERKQCM